MIPAELEDVTELEETMWFRVKSESRSGMEHFVDLMEEQCDCEDFRMRRKLNEGQWCKHIRRAYMKLGKMVRDRAAAIMHEKYGRKVNWYK